jgi:hypothetical protein
MLIGREIEVGVGLESTRGTPIDLIKSLKKTTFNVQAVVEKAIDESVCKDFEDASDIIVVKKQYVGDIDGTLHADSIGYFLLNVYGGVVSTAVDASVTSHVFNLTDSKEHTALSIYRKDNDVDEDVYGGGVVKSLEITIKPQEILKYKASLVCATLGTSTETYTCDKEYAFVGKDVSIKVADTEAGLSSATALKVKEATIKYTPAILDEHYLGSYNSELYNGVLGLEIDITKNLENTTFKTMYEANTSKYMQIIIEGGVTIGTASHPKITLVLNNAMITAYSADGAKDDLVEEKITFKAFRNRVDAKASQLTLVNLTDSYELAS